MATVIDALVVELGLDPSKFTKGQREAVDSLKKMEEAARRKAQATEEASARISAAVEGVSRRFLALGGLLFGGAGLEHFIASTVRADAATYRFAKTVGLNVQELSKWQGVVEQLGGTSEEVADTFGRVKGGLEAWRQGFPSELAADLRNIAALTNTPNFDVRDKAGRFKAPEEIFLEMNKAFQGQDKAAAAAALARFNYSQGMIRALLMESSELDKMLKKQEQIRAITEEEGRAAAELASAWTRATQAAASFGDVMLQLIPVKSALEDIATLLSAISHPEKYGLPGLVKWFQLIEQAMGKAYGYISGLGPLFEAFHNIAGWLNNRTPTSPPVFSGTVAEPAPTSFGRPHGGAPFKAGANAAGPLLAGTAALADAITRSVPGLKEFTAGHDIHHLGDKSKHNEGLALDFTLRDPSQYAAVSAKLRDYLTSLGIDATVLDSSKRDSDKWTGPHIHLQLNSPAAAAAYAERAGAAASYDQRQSSVRQSTTTVTIQKMEVRSNDAASFASRDFPEYMRDMARTFPAMGGPR